MASPEPRRRGNRPMHKVEPVRHRDHRSAAVGGAGQLQGALLLGQGALDRKSVV